jgi:hypothetical protein
LEPGAAGSAPTPSTPRFAASDATQRARPTNLRRYDPIEIPGRLAAATDRPPRHLVALRRTDGREVHVGRPGSTTSAARHQQRDLLQLAEEIRARFPPRRRRQTTSGTGPACCLRRDVTGRRDAAGRPRSPQEGPAPCGVTITSLTPRGAGGG